MAAPMHVYETFVRATPDEVWAAITDPAFTRRYFHRTAFETELRPGSQHRYLQADGTTAVDGTIEEVEAGQRLVMTWHVLYDAAMAEEPPSRVEWLLRPANGDGTITRVTVRHYDLGMSPLTSDNVALGWVGILDSMKSLLETGEALGELVIEPAQPSDDGAEHERLAACANGEAWELLAFHPIDAGRADELLERAYASAYHWRQAVGPDAVELARSAWLLARSHVAVGNADLALHYAQRCAALTQAATAAADFDVADAHEGMARANAASGHLEEARRHREAAAAVAIADSEDRAIFTADLAGGPWFGLDERMELSTGSP